METLTQKIIAGVAIFALGQFVAWVRSYMSIMERIRELELRVNMSEHQSDKIIQKLDNVLQIQNEIKVDLQNKQNRQQ